MLSRITSGRVGLPLSFQSILKYWLKRLLPARLMIRFLVWAEGFPEPELRLLPYLCDKSKVSIDVGASCGLYTIHLMQYSKKCYAFEPRIKAAIYLMELLSGLIPFPQIEAVALSDHTGQADLKVLTRDLGRSTLEKRNPLEKSGTVELIPVPVRRLDDYIFSDRIGCIKIDVEGHEEAVLRGARSTLERDCPVLIIEAEERHNPGSVERVRNFLADLYYRGFFYHNYRLESLACFRLNINQHIDNLNNKGEYINNFIFLPESFLPKIKDLLL